MLYTEINKDNFINIMSRSKYSFSEDGARELFIFLDNDEGDCVFDPDGINEMYTEYCCIDEFIAKFNLDKYTTIEELENTCEYLIKIDKESFIIRN